MDLVSRRLARFMRSFSDTALDQERFVYGIVEGLAAADLKIAARGILRLVRSRRREQCPHPEQILPSNPDLPAGPYRTLPDVATILIFVPRSLESRLIDDATGGYGFSHIAADIGEIDLASGKRVMVESMMHVPVRRVFQDRYGKRPFICIPLRSLIANPEHFRSCVLARLGEQYDYEEALTWGKVHDPAKQVCSDLVAECLPDAVRLDIARKRRTGAFHHSLVSIHRYGKSDFRVFVSPNAFAMYFGAPKGENIINPNTLVEPKTLSTPDILVKRASAYTSAAWTIAGISGTALLGWAVMRVFRRR